MECLFNTIKKHIFLFVITILFCSCLIIKNYDYKEIECKELPKEAVNIAIKDYSKRLKRQKDSSKIVAVLVFVQYTSTDWFYISMMPLQFQLCYDSSVLSYLNDKYPVEWLDNDIGRIPSSWLIPTDFKEMDGVLYVWQDPQVVVTENLKSVLAKYDLLYYSKIEDPVFLSFNSAPYINYIFCKTNYKKRYYYRIKAGALMPLPSCRCGKSMDNN